MPVIKVRCARDALLHTFNIGVFKSIKKNSTTTKLIYNKSANIVEGYYIAFDTHDCGNFHTVPVTGSDWKYGDMRSPSLHGGLLDAGRMQSNQDRCYWKLDAISHQNPQSCYNFIT